MESDAVPEAAPPVVEPGHNHPDSEERDNAADIEVAEEPIAAEGDETFLEEEEEEGDVSNIIGPVAEDEQP